MNTDRPNSADWLSADRPIESRKDDILSRKNFSEALAGAVSGWLGRDSLILALYGPWGTGKSSIKNMVVESLHSNSPKVLTVEFNPWQLANRPSLSEAFFDEVGLALGKGDVGSNRLKRSLLSRYRRWARRLQGGGDFIRAARNLFGTILVVLGVATLGTAWLHSITVTILFGLLTILAGVLALVSKLADAAVEFFEAGTDIGSKSLGEVKDEIAKDLRKLKAPILVILDDIDRLTSHEILEVFQLIKANADFPNLVYLLLCERSVVEENVQSELNVSGREYLEKIVQVAFDVPMLDVTRVHQALFQRLNSLLTGEAVSSRFTKKRWSSVFLSGLRAYFATLRDVNRFISTLSFQFSTFTAHDVFEVNPIDLIALEVIRVFEPDVYRALQSSKAILTTNGRRDQPQADVAAKAVESIIQRGSEDHRGELREVIKQLFPTVEWALGGTQYANEFADRWYQDLRVCSHKIFDRYFRLAVSEQELSQSDAQALLRSRGNREQLRSQLEMLNARGLLGLALEELGTYEDTVEPTQIEPYVTAIFDVSDLLSDETRGTFDVPSHWRVGFLISHALEKLPDSSVRLKVLTESISRTNGLFMPVEFVALIDPSESSTKVGILSETDLAVARSAAVEKIRSAAASGSLAQHPKLAIILALWRRWGSNEDVNRYIGELTKTHAGTLQFLKSLVVRSLSAGTGDYLATERFYIRRKDVEVFLPMDSLSQKVRAIPTDTLTEEDQRAIQAFERAVDRWKTGKPDDDPFARD